MPNENQSTVSKSRGPGGRFTGTGTNAGTNAGAKPGSGSAAPGRDSKPLGPQPNNPGSGPGSNANSNPKPGTGAATNPDANPAKPTIDISFDEGQAPGETFLVHDTGAKKNRGGRPVGFSPKAQQEEKKASVHENNVELANALVMVLSGVMQATLGLYAAMAPSESEMIAAPLVRILDRTTPKTLDHMQKYADPLMFGVGFVAYSFRCISQRPITQKPNAVAMTSTGEATTDAIPTGPEVLATAPGNIGAGLSGGLP